MVKNELIRLLASMSPGELQEVYSVVKQYSASAETIASLKRVFDSNHLIEFITEDGNMILSDKFITATPVNEYTVRVQFAIFGIVCDYQLAVDIDVSKKWVLNSQMPFYDFGDTPVPAFIIKFSDRDEDISPTRIPFMPIKGLSVCKIVHNSYNESADTGVEAEAMDLLSEIKNKLNEREMSRSCVKVVPECVSSDKPTREPQLDEETPNKTACGIQVKPSIIKALKLTNDWINQDPSHRIVFNVSRAFSYEDDHTTSKTTNNYSFVFNTSEWVEEKKHYCFSDGPSAKKGVYSIVEPDDFINGSVTWDHNRKNLVITNEDKTCIIRITYMKDSDILNLDKEKQGLTAVFNNLV